jgi:hypothetical protein
MKIVFAKKRYVILSNIKQIRNKICEIDISKDASISRSYNAYSYQGSKTGGAKTEHFLIPCHKLATY